MDLHKGILRRGMWRRAAAWAPSWAPSWAIAALLGVAVVTSTAGTAQRTMVSAEPMPEGTPLAWVQAAVDHELKVISPEGTGPVRFRQRRIDAHGDTTRELIETQEGTVARLIERNGRPLSAAEDAAERERLQGELDSPASFLKHHEHDKAQREDAIRLVRLLPQAMLYSYATGQPQPKGTVSPQVVIDFRPDPAFHPPTTRADILTGIEGRVWIDAQTRRMTRIEGHVLHPVDFGYGLVARIFPGGTVELEQVNAGGDRWVYSHLAEDVQVRVLLLKNIAQKSDATSWDFHMLPALPHYQDAIRMLLQMQIRPGS